MITISILYHSTMSNEFSSHKHVTKFVCLSLSKPSELHSKASKHFLTLGSMATALSQQLQALKGPVDKKKRISLLFDVRQAAQLDIDTIYQVGSEGLAELEKYDDRFAPFAQSLFSESNKRLDRDLLTSDVNKSIDESINYFLKLISPYFLLRPAQKALEYLIRRYRFVNYNCRAAFF